MAKDKCFQGVFQRKAKQTGEENLDGTVWTVRRCDHASLFSFGTKTCRILFRMLDCEWIRDFIVFRDFVAFRILFNQFSLCPNKAIFFSFHLSLIAFHLLIIRGYIPGCAILFCGAWHTFPKYVPLVFLSFLCNLKPNF